MKKTDVARLIREILNGKDYGIRIPDDFNEKDSLFSNGIIDSFGLLGFINELQLRFEFKVESRDIHPGNFETLEKIADFISAKKGGVK